MNPWKEHIAQLDELLKVLKEQLLPYWKPAHKKEKLAQLKSVEKSINQLQKSNTPIPDELRDLKFRLLNELELIKEAETARAEIQKIIQPFIDKARAVKGLAKSVPDKIERNKEQNEPQVTIQRLVEAGIIKPGTTLFKEYKGIEYLAEITQDGSIKMNLDDKEILLNSPSAAAVQCTRKPTNGWTWWNIDDQSEVKTLDYYRQKYKEHEA